MLLPIRKKLSRDKNRNWVNRGKEGMRAKGSKKYETTHNAVLGLN